MICADCMRGIEAGAKACACGWLVPLKRHAPTMPAAVAPPRAVVPSNTPFMDECREAYRNSLAYRLIHDGKPLRTAVAAALPREPGEDREESNAAGQVGPSSQAHTISTTVAESPAPAAPALGIPLDPLEVEFQNTQADRMEP